MNDKEFDWVWRNEPCTICSSLYYTLLERLKDPWRVFEMVYAQPYQFNRRLGEGINVFTPGDKPLKHNSIRNPEVQKRIDTVLKDSNRVKYLFSQFAKTNNGVYALMDVKAHNRTRLMELHNIISEGTHKVEDIEESVHSLFLAVMNPEDTQSIEEFQSFEDRIEYIKIPYVMDVNTEVAIYRNTFGKQIEDKFLPMVLENFARTIVATRLNHRSPALLDWIGNPRKYSRYCDDNLHLLKMEIYSGRIPKWLSEEDKKRFTPEVRAKVLTEGENEGVKGISGRESIKIFNDLYSRYAKNGSMINMATLKEFFDRMVPSVKELVPQGFLDSMIKLYNFSVLQEVKECLYYYNEERISRDIQNYIFAVNFEPGSSHTCIYSGEKIDINEDFFSSIESRLLGSRENKYFRYAFREEVQRRYTSNTLPLEILQEGKDIRATKLYQDLYDRYVYNLKEKVLDPFLDNENFRRAIKDFDEPEFSTYDKRIQDDISFLIRNLGDKFGYSKEGAKEICIYVVDNHLAEAFDNGKASL
jgi:predicted Ser/Thr protein kinase